MAYVAVLHHIRIVLASSIFRKIGKVSKIGTIERRHTDLNFDLVASVPYPRAVKMAALPIPLAAPRTTRLPAWQFCIIHSVNADKKLCRASPARCLRYVICCYWMKKLGNKCQLCRAAGWFSTHATGC
jgi:hypothetical protein